MVDGDPITFGQLFERHYPAVCRYLSVRMAADAVEDVAAETFLVAWRRQSELPANPLPWLLNTAAKCSSNQRRSLSRSAALAPHEIATALGISRVVARARLSRAQRRLQKTLDAALRTEDLRPPCPVSTTPSAS